MIYIGTYLSFDIIISEHVNYYFKLSKLSTKNIAYKLIMRCIAYLFLFFLHVRSNIAFSKKVLCWTYGCNHYNEKYLCKFYRIPKDKKIMKIMVNITQVSF